MVGLLVSEVYTGITRRMFFNFNRVTHLTPRAYPTAKAKSRSQSRMLFLIVAFDGCKQSLSQFLPVQRPCATVMVLPSPLLPSCCWIHFYTGQSLHAHAHQSFTFLCFLYLTIDLYHPLSIWSHNKKPDTDESYVTAKDYPEVADASWHEGQQRRPAIPCC